MSQWKRGRKDSKEEETRQGVYNSCHPDDKTRKEGQVAGPGPRDFPTNLGAKQTTPVEFILGNSFTFALPTAITIQNMRPTMLSSLTRLPRTPPSRALFSTLRSLRQQQDQQPTYQPPTPPSEPDNPHVRRASSTPSEQNSTELTCPPAQRAFYKSFGRPIAKVFFMALFTYQVLHYSWLRLEAMEEKEDKQGIIAQIPETRDIEGYQRLMEPQSGTRGSGKSVERACQG